LDQSVEKADVVNVDFKNPEAASKTITRWAKQKTKGGLKLNEINYAPSTKIALTSAVYFKANWIYKFNPAQPGTFYTPNGPIQVDMMNMKRKFRWGKLGEFAEWVAIPYESEDSLIIILPNRDQTLESVINIMEEKDLIDVLYDFDRDSSNVRRF
jgi:serpin B